MTNLLCVQDAGAVPSDIHIHLHSLETGVVDNKMNGNHMEYGLDYDDDQSKINEDDDDNGESVSLFLNILFNL